MPDSSPNPKPATTVTVLAGLVVFTLLIIVGSSFASGQETVPPTAARILFSSQGKTGIAQLSDKPIEFLTVTAPNQVTWQPGPVFNDGRRLLLLSMEARRDGPGRPFEEYYTQTPTHLWTYDLPTKTLHEIADQPRLATFMTPALLLGNDRLLVQVVRDRVGQIYRIHLDGSEPHEFTRQGEGLPYGLSLSPNGQRAVAFHLASPQGYQIWTSDLNGQNRHLVAGHPDHLYFGTSWSPDGAWILYVDCDFGHDPGHDWADVCINRPDGSAPHRLTDDQSMWFAATYGSPENRGGGSNLPAWTDDGRILYPRRMRGSQVAWEYQTERPDTDHFNRDYHPERAQGGCSIMLLDPQTRTERALTPAVAGTWDFRATPSPDGRFIAFCRAQVGQPPALWRMHHDGSDARLITRGSDDQGADHPRWIGAHASAEARELLRRFRTEFVKLPAVTPAVATPTATTPAPATSGSWHISKFEITQDLWQAVMGTNPSRWQGPRNSVELLSLDEAIAFCRATAMMQAAEMIAASEVIRLPTEAEWEFAARGGTTTRYSFGDDASQLDAYAWHHGNAAGNDPPVGAKQPNPFGLYDMHGYLWEWCQPAAHPSLAPNPASSAATSTHLTTPVPPATATIRGGSWKDNAEHLVSTSRREIDRGTRDDAVGLRCVLSTLSTESKNEQP